MDFNTTGLYVVEEQLVWCRRTLVNVNGVEGHKEGILRHGPNMDDREDVRTRC